MRRKKSVPEKDQRTNEQKESKADVNLVFLFLFYFLFVNIAAEFSFQLCLIQSTVDKLFFNKETEKNQEKNKK